MGVRKLSVIQNRFKSQQTKRKEIKLNTNNNLNNQTHQFAENIWNFFARLFTVTWKGIFPFTNHCREKPLVTLIALGGSYLAIYKVVEHALHLKLMVKLWPSLVNSRFLNWLLHFQQSTHRWFFVITFLWTVIIVLGARRLFKERKIKNILESIGLVNRIGQTPLLASEMKFDQYRSGILFYARSVSHESFQAKKSELEAAFGLPIESIDRWSDDPRYIEVIFSTKPMPTHVHFHELVERSKLKQNQFYIGENKQGILYTEFQKLPHLMIAGTTGAGKSVFFKQVLAGLLTSTDHLQVYFVDLKNGLEAVDFKEAPNVAIAKNTEEAAYFLRKLVSEMNKRFSYLETKGYKSIDPKRDKLDRIIVAVDEASELYSDKLKSDPDYELSTEVQALTNSIARLGRAAGIHLILATQKVNKESINTIIQENISARMCFKMNTLQGSLQVLGHKGATELSNNPGRGIWQLGNEEYEVQVPYLTGDDVKYISGMVAYDFETGQKKLHQPMIGKAEPSSANDTKDNAIKNNLVDMDV